MKKIALLTLALCSTYGTTSIQAARNMTQTPMYSVTDDFTYNDKLKPLIETDNHKKTVCQELISTLRTTAKYLQEHLASYAKCLKEDKKMRIQNIIDELDAFAQSVEQQLNNLLMKERSPA